MLSVEIEKPFVEPLGLMEKYVRHLAIDLYKGYQNTKPFTGSFQRMINNSTKRINKNLSRAPEPQRDKPQQKNETTQTTVYLREDARADALPIRSCLDVGTVGVIEYTVL